MEEIIISDNTQNQSSCFKTKTGLKLMITCMEPITIIVKLKLKLIY